jgi:ATP-dependent DNA helicase RecG
MEFIAKHTLDRFFLIGDQRVSVRSWIAREVVSNTLVHREYSRAFPAKIIIGNDQLHVENWNRSTTHGRIDPDDFTPQPKNPILARFFVNIGRADQLGSGVRNLYKFTKIYSGSEPALFEGDVFKTTVPLVEEQDRLVDVPVNILDAQGIVQDVPVNVLVNVPDAQVIAQNVPVNVPVDEQAGKPAADHAAAIVKLIENNPQITLDALADSLRVSRKTIQRHIGRLKDDGLLRRVGSDKAGGWVIRRQGRDE